MIDAHEKNLTKVGDQIHYGGSKTFGSQSCHHSKADAESELSVYPVGGEVLVIYDPVKPNDSALKVSDDGGIFWCFLIIAGCALIWIVAADGLKTLRDVDQL